MLHTSGATRIYTIKFIEQIYPLGNKPISDTVNSCKQRHGKTVTILSEENAVHGLSKFFQIPSFQLKTQSKAA